MEALFIYGAGIPVAFITAYRRSWTFHDKHDQFCYGDCSLEGTYKNVFWDDPAGCALVIFWPLYFSYLMVLTVKRVIPNSIYTPKEVRKALLEANIEKTERELGL